MISPAVEAIGHGKDHLNIEGTGEHGGRLWRHPREAGVRGADRDPSTARLPSLRSCNRSAQDDISINSLQRCDLQLSPVPIHSEAGGPFKPRFWLECEQRDQYGPMMPPICLAAGFAGVCFAVASRTSRYFNPLPVLNRTTVSSGLKKPLARSLR